MIVHSLLRHRRRLDWSQQRLAERSGLSRAEISAIETGRVVPSTAAALSLARAFNCSVETLFSLRRIPSQTAQWAWKPSQHQGRFWQARVRGKTLFFPCERTLAGTLGHDGIFQDGQVEWTRPGDPEQTLVIAGCDPAVGLLAARVQALSGFRVLPLTRSSRRAVELLGQGLVHAAGLHFSHGLAQNENSATAQSLLKEEFRLLRLARWEEGVALAPSLKTGSIRTVLASNLRWVGREEGSGSRQCLDQILGRRRKPRGYHHQAPTHHGVTETIRSGWAQAGVCLRLTAEEQGLHFLKVREENYDYCFPAAAESEPAIQTLLSAVRSSDYRKDLDHLPGYQTSDSGDLK
ncbi:MAG: substrate-binding domain-containing protein [Acidobacteriota bacterium]